MTEEVNGVEAGPAARSSGRAGSSPAGGAAPSAGPPEGRPKTLLVGMGNPILSDDAVGIRLAGAVARRLGPRPGLDVIEECCVGGLNLVDLMAGYDRVVVLDSIMTADGVPGTWYAFDAHSLRETLNLRNVHDANFATSLELGRTMGTYLPTDGEIHVFAVEVAETTTFSETMSAALEAAFPDLLEEIGAEVEALLGG